MNCDSCGVDIPPAWVKVIASNICVECQGPIMSDNTVELMAGLKNALEQMPNDPQGIAGWLLSNYRMQKVGTGEPTGFIGSKSKMQAGNGEIKIAENPLERFHKLAGVKVQAPEKYKALISEINGGILDDEKDVPEQREESENYLPETDDPEYTKQALKAMIGQKSAKRQISEPVIPEDDEEDFTGIHPSLQQGRLIRLAKQRDLDMGGVGIIKRG